MKEDQRVLLTKRLLQEGLVRLLEKKEIDVIQVSELCKESGINRATFYRHYGQPRDILTEIRHTMVEDIHKLAIVNKVEENIEKWLISVCHYFYDHKEDLRVLFKTRNDEEFIKLIQSIYTKQMDLIKKNSKIDDEEEIKLMTYCYAGGIYYLLRQWIIEPIEKSPKEVASIIQNFFQVTVK